MRNIMNRTEYLKSLTEQIRNKNAKTLVLEEITAHIEDQKQAYLLDGMGEDEAEEMAVKEMGNPVDTGVQLDKIYRPKTDVWMLAAMLVLTLIWIVMQSIICLQYNDLSVIQNTYHTRTIYYNLIGLLVMAIVYFADYRLLNRFIWPIYGVYLAGSVFFLHTPAFGEYYQHLRFGQAIHILFVPLFAVFCYRFREQKGKGILKAFGLLLFNILFLLFSGAFTSATMLLSFMTCLITLCAAAYRGVFGGRKNLQGSILTASIIGIPLLFFGDVLLFDGRFLFLAEYQIQRIRVMLNPAAYAAQAGYQTMLVRDQLSSASLLGGGTVGKVGELSGAWCDYVLICLTAYFGLIVAFLVIGIIAAYFLRALHISLMQSNRLGFLLGVSCSSILILKTVVYVAMNFGIGLTVSIDMPFLTYGLYCSVVNFLFMGIILSVYRNTNLLPEPKKTPPRHSLRIERATGK